MTSTRGELLALGLLAATTVAHGRAPHQLGFTDPASRLVQVRGSMFGGPDEVRVGWLRLHRASRASWGVERAVRSGLPPLVPPGPDLAPAIGRPRPAPAVEAPPPEPVVFGAEQRPARVTFAPRLGPLRAEPPTPIPATPVAAPRVDLVPPAPRPPRRIRPGVSPSRSQEGSSLSVLGAGGEVDEANAGPPGERPATPGGSTGSAYPAGSAREAPLGVSDLTRWGQAKKVLGRLGSSYVEADISSFMKTFSKDFEQEASIFRNAVSQDFQRQANIRLDFELLEYRHDFDTLQARIRWLRTTVTQDEGVADEVTTGQSTILFDRHDGFRVKNWRGLPPFGQDDPLLAEQTGQAAPGLEVPLPPEQTLSPFLVDGRGSSVVDDFGTYVDLEAGTLTPVANGSPAPGPGDDLFLVFVASIASPVRFRVTALNGAEVADCGPGASLFVIRDLDPAGGVASFDSDDIQNLVFMGVKTNEGNRALVEMFYVYDIFGTVDYPGDVEPEDKADLIDQFHYFLRDQDQPAAINPLGSEDCVHQVGSNAP